MKPIVIAVIFLLVGSLVGAGGIWYYRDIEVVDAFSAGVAYQQTIAPVTEKPASVTLTFGAATFDHTGSVAGSGAVSADTAVTDYLLIENMDETRLAKTPILSLENSVTGTEGLHDDLQTDYTEISITIGGVTKSLYHNGDFTAGVLIGNLAVGDLANVTITFTLEAAVAGSFQDLQTYTNYLYLYQPSADYADVVTFTVTT